MREDEFLRLVGEKLHNDFIRGIQPTSNTGIGFKIVDGNLVSYTVDGIRNIIGSSDLSDIEHHQTRFNINYKLRQYFSAEYHLLRIIGLKMDMIKRRHCEI